MDLPPFFQGITTYALRILKEVKHYCSRYVPRDKTMITTITHYIRILDSNFIRMLKWTIQVVLICRPSKDRMSVLLLFQSKAEVTPKKGKWLPSSGRVTSKSRPNDDTKLMKCKRSRFHLNKLKLLKFSRTYGYACDKRDFETQCGHILHLKYDVRVFQSFCAAKWIGHLPLKRMGT